MSRVQIPECAVRSPRLSIHALTPDHLRADLVSREAFAAALAVPVAADWPPNYWEPAAINWLLDKHTTHPLEVFWHAWTIRLNDPALVVGTVGFKGPPDSHGLVEIGYGVVTSHWRRGIASEAVALMLKWAANTGRITGICAHTLADDPASSGVLKKNHFALTARVQDPQDGPIDRYEHALFTAKR